MLAIHVITYFASPGVTGAGRAPTPMPVWNSSSASPENPTAGFWQGGDFWECHRFGVLASPAPACRDAIARIGSALRNHSGDGNGTFYVNDTVRIQGIVQDDAQGCKRKHLFENCGLDDPELVTFSLRFDDPNSTTCCRSIVIGSGNSASSGPTFGNFTRVPYAMQHGTATSTSFWAMSPAFPSSMPPATRRVTCSTWCTVPPEANWCLQSHVVPDSCLFIGRPMWQNDFGLYLYNGLRHQFDPPVLARCGWVVGWLGGEWWVVGVAQWTPTSI